MDSRPEKGREPEVAWSSGRLRHQIAHPNQVISRRCEGEHPSHFVRPPEPCLALQGYRLHPPEDFLYPFSFSLTDRIARPSGGPRVDRTPPIRVVLRHMRRDSELPHLLYKVPRIITAIGAQRDPLTAARNLFDH